MPHAFQHNNIYCSNWCGECMSIYFFHLCRIFIHFLCFRMKHINVAISHCLLLNKHCIPLFLVKASNSQEILQLQTAVFYHSMDIPREKNKILQEKKFNIWNPVKIHLKVWGGCGSFVKYDYVCRWVPNKCEQCVIPIENVAKTMGLRIFTEAKQRNNNNFVKRKWRMHG